MQTGLAISSVGHGAVILAVLFGGLLDPEPLPPPEVADVAIITEEDFAALTRPASAPDVADQAPEPAPPPAPDPADAPEPPAPSEAPDVAPPPEETPPPAPETLPEPPAPLAPEADVTDTAPETPAPPPAETGPPTDLVAVPRPAPRVAPEAAPPPPPEAEAAPEVVERTAPAPLPDAPPVVEEAPAAPEEATTEIVTEAEEASTAPLRSVRPAARPAGRPPPPAPAATAGSSSTAASENAAATEPQVPTGPPITQAEADAFRVAVARCWNVGSLSTEALAVTVTLGFDMTREGKPVGETIRLIASTGGGERATRSAFDAARRAVLRCGVEGYDLPAEKYGQWKQVEITFDPAQMRLR